MRDTDQHSGVSSCLDPAEITPLASSSLSSGSPRNKLFQLGLVQRLALFVLIFAAEWGPLTHFVHKGRGAGELLQIGIAFVSLLLALGYFRSKSSFRRISTQVADTPIRWSFLVLHFAALGAFLGISAIADSGGALDYLIAGLWYAAGAAAIVLAAGAFVPWRIAVEFLRSTGYAWIYALGAAIIAGRAIISTTLWNGHVWNPALDLSWKPATDATFTVVQGLLHLLFSNVIADRSTMVIGTSSFKVQILPWCAGFEGTALMLVFSVAWLAYFRREFRFPRALLLIPAGMLVIWLANALRITALIVIGVAGAPKVAAGGFHSQAGWIAFNCVALGFAVMTRHMSWFASQQLATPAVNAVHPKLEAVHSSSKNPTAAYLTPFLAILAAAMISRAATGGFEWLYPLRFIAAAAALWFFRSAYSDLNWRFGGFSVLAGFAVFGIWLGLDLMTHATQTSALGANLAAMSTSARVAWLIFRTAAAVITVPIAEELAFRGFLIRRISSADFDSLSPRHYTYLAVFVSSLAFGLLHGDRWIAGTVAGLIYAFAFLRRGRIGDAIIAHATTNALLAAWVLSAGKWYLW